MYYYWCIFFPVSSSWYWTHVNLSGLSVSLIPHILYFVWLIVICLKHLDFCFAKCVIRHSLPLSQSHFLDTVRKSISEASISSPHADPPVPSDPSEFPTRKLSVKSQTCQDLGSHSNCSSQSPPLLSECTVCHTWTCLHWDYLAVYLPTYLLTHSLHIKMCFEGVAWQGGFSQ